MPKSELGRSELSPVEPRSSGVLVRTSDLAAQLYEFINAAVPLSPDEFSYPDMFAEFIRQHAERYGQHEMLCLPPSTHLTGDLQLDFDTSWIKPRRLSGIACMGDLSIDGDIINRNRSFGPLLFVKGTLRINNLIKGGAPIIVLGDVVAGGIVVADYNDGVMRVAGGLKANAYVLLDQDVLVRGTVDAPLLSSDEDTLRALLVDEVFENEREDMPNVELMWSHARSGRSILQAQG